MRPLIVLMGYPYYKLLTNKIEAQATQSCRFTISKNDMGNSAKLLSRPIFTKFYVVTAVADKSKEYQNYILKLAKSKYIHLIVLCQYQEEFQSITEKCIMEQISYAVFNSYATKKDDAVFYIKHELLLKSEGKINLNDSLSELIYRRAKFQGSSLDSFLELLSNTACTRKDICRVIIVKERLPLSQFGFAFFFGERNKLLNQLILRYRYAPDYLVERLKKYIEILDAIYADYMNGRFTRITLDAWILSTGSSLEIKSEFQATRLLTALEQLSYQKYLIVKYRVLEIDCSNRLKASLNLYRLSKLCTIRGN